MQKYSLHTYINTCIQSKGANMYQNEVAENVKIDGEMKMLTDVQILSNGQRAMSKIDLLSNGYLPVVESELRVLSSSQRPVSAL